MPQKNKKNSIKAKKIVKTGDRVVARTNAPTAISQSTRMVGYPRQVTRGDRFQVGHSELFNSLQTDGSGSGVQRYRLNPGNHLLFPWLWTIASRYEFYSFCGIRVRFVPMVSTATAGQVVISISADPNEPQPTVTEKPRLLSLVGACSGTCWAPLTMTLPNQVITNRHRQLAELYVNSENSLETIDPRVTDFGNLYVAYYGTAPTAQVLGDLYIDYVVELRVPQVLPAQTIAGTEESITEVGLKQSQYGQTAATGFYGSIPFWRWPSKASSSGPDPGLTVQTIGQPGLGVGDYVNPETGGREPCLVAETGGFHDVMMRLGFNDEGLTWDSVKDAVQDCTLKVIEGATSRVISTTKGYLQRKFGSYPSAAPQRWVSEIVASFGNVLLEQGQKLLLDITGGITTTLPDDPNIWQGLKRYGSSYGHFSLYPANFLSPMREAPPTKVTTISIPQWTSQDSRQATVRKDDSKPPGLVQNMDLSGQKRP